MSAPGVAAVGRLAAPALAALHAEAFDAPWPASAFAELLAQPGVSALAAAGGEGFVLVRTVLDEAEILTLAVRPADRRRGCARALVEAAAATLAHAGVAQLWLEVAEDNAPALALYAAVGFRAAGRRPGYYARAGGARVGAVVMRRRLAACGGA